MDQNSQWGMVLQSASEWDISELHKGGVAFLRVDFLWSVVQPTAGAPFQWGHYDRIVRWAADRGMFILAGLGGTPGWAVNVYRRWLDNRFAYRVDAYPPQDLTLWDNFVRAAVQRYGGRVQHWGIWNEPDSFNEPPNVCFWRGTQQEFFDDIVARAVNIIRSLGDHKICVPDLAHSESPGSWLNPLLARFGRSIHAVSVHAYNGSGDGSDVVNRARLSWNIVQAYNAANGTQIQLWVTETGWHRTQHSDATISSKIQDLVRETRNNPWVRKIFPYVWSDAYADGFDFKAYTRLTRLQWAGYKAAINSPQPEVPLERDALLVSHTIPTQMRAGSAFAVRMTFRNLGRVQWQPNGSIRLGFGSMVTGAGVPYAWNAFFPDATMIPALAQVQGIVAPARVRVQTATAVPRGGEATFEFSIATPPSPGFYLISWCMVDDSEGLFFGQGWVQKLYVN